MAYGVLVAMIHYGLALLVASTENLLGTNDEYDYSSYYSGISEAEEQHDNSSDYAFYLTVLTGTFPGVSPFENRSTIMGISDYYYSNGDGEISGSYDTIANNSQRGTVQGLCGFPPYCDREKCLKLLNESLGECRVRGGAAVFTFAIAVLGICIIGANLLLPTVVLKNNTMRTQYDYIKVSLAFADILQGILLLTAVLPNVGKFENMSEKEAVDYVTQDTNSPVAIIVGSLVILSSQSSLLHLMFLSIERFIAIKWPFRHLRRKGRTVTTTILVIWVTSTVCCFIPAAFPDYFIYQFQPVLLIHMVTTASAAGSTSNIYGILCGVVFMVLPYVITVVFCVLTGITSYVKIKSHAYKFGLEVRRLETTSSGAGGRNSEKDGRRKHGTSYQLKPEISAFLTIVIMIAAFTVTLIPFGIVVILFTINVLHCSNYTYPYLITFYAVMSNSLANAIIYTIRDGRFRTAVRKLFHCDKKPGTMKTLSTSAS